MSPAAYASVWRTRAAAREPVRSRSAGHGMKEILELPLVTFSLHLIEFSSFCRIAAGRFCSADRERRYGRALLGKYGRS